MEPRKPTDARIRVLPPAVYRKIAAGEVIDRPAAIVRELMDNAIDSGATEVTVSIEAGGVDSVRVVDDGRGMDEDDLRLAAEPHATSKIETADDLLKLSTLGFRGEALASISAVARLEIVSNPGTGASRLSADFGSVPVVESFHGAKGTSVAVSALFESFPARKQFLKRSQAEGTVCRQVFVDKAIAFPEVGFRYFSDGELKLFLPAQDLKSRVAAAYHDAAPASLLSSIAASGSGFSFEAVVAGPAISRNDRRYIQVFVNRRRISEFSLVQALEYGYASFLPGGKEPVAFLFLEVDPALADFNIHPAKKEARIKNIQDIHHRVSETVRAYLHDLAVADFSKRREAGSDSFNPEKYLAETPGFFAPPPGPASGRPADWPRYDRETATPREAATFAAETVRLSGSIDSFRNPAAASGGTAGTAPFRYLGQAFNLFLVCEVGDELYLIDQHAAHERLLFEKLKSAPPTVQELLVPAVIETDGPDEDALLEERRLAAEKVGFRIEKSGEGRWAATAVPAGYRESSRRLHDDLLETLKDDSDFETALFATVACRSAVKDGELLSATAACAIIDGALRLENPRCPHGRPIWHRISRDELFSLVQRTV
jgi:DNA mismatch repair protein MutL